MLTLWYFDYSPNETKSPRNCAGVLYDATDVAVSQQINGDYSLSFKYPRNGELAEHSYMRVNSIVKCEGQRFRIKKISKTAEPMMSIDCEHIFNYAAKHTHIPNIGSTDRDDYIGEDAYNVLAGAVELANKHSTADFSLLTDAELAELGMTRLSVNIDFESIDKTNLYDVMLKIIECAGMGEIYCDNYKIAIVERIGSDTNVILNTATNLTDITIEYDTSDMITRLYPYGKDDLTISAATSNTDGKIYIQSDNAGRYGIIEGYADYSDCEDVDKLWKLAVWQMDEDNPERIDVPSINISGTVADLSRIDSRVDQLSLGDGVLVMDNGETFSERVITLTRYPYEARADSMSIGRVKKDMFFYLNQLGLLAKRYKSISTNDGRVQGNKVLGLSVKNGNIYFNGKKLAYE